MRRVIIFSTEPSSGMGGIATAAKMFTDGLKDLDINTKSITTHSPRHGKARNSFTFLLAISTLISTRIIEIARKQPPSIAYIHAGPKGSLVRKIVIAYLARALGMEVNTHYHSATFEIYLNSTGAWKTALLLLCKKSNKNIVLSSWWKETFESHKIENIYIIPNAISPPEETIQTTNQIKPQKEAKKTIFSIARLVREKNIHLVMEALQSLPEDYQLKIAGDGPFRKDLEELSEKLNLSNRVEFLGWLNEKQKIHHYLNSEVLAVPSSHDSFGIVYIEALSLGCPIVIGPNPAVSSAVAGLPGVFKAKKFTSEEIRNSIKDSMNSVTPRKTIADYCKNKYNIKAISRDLSKTLLNKNRGD